MSDERRQFTRVHFQVYAEINCQGEVINGRVVDLSLKGLFVYTDKKLDVGEVVDVKLRLPLTNPPLEFHLRAEAMRNTETGIGFRIAESDVQSFTHLRNIVAMQAENPDLVLEELLPKP
jgi:hypothetical protein